MGTTTGDAAEAVVVPRVRDRVA
ncbi:MAG: hypothetical protein K0S37_4103, partial [Microbacterium sp.]|nr:hypothetical protein [Microbacterium sp.]